MGVWGRVCGIFVVGVAVIALAFSLGVDRSEPVASGQAWVSVTGLPMASAIPMSPAERFAPTSAAPRRTVTHLRDNGCRLDEGPTALAPVPPGTADRVRAAWRRLDEWAVRNGVAPAAGPPADDAVIAAAQRRAGTEFPAELIASLRVHDGGGPLLPPLFRPLSASAIADEQHLMCGVVQSLGDDGVDWWNGSMLPIAVDGGGDFLYVQGPTLGVHPHEDFPRAHESGSLVTFLEQTADALDGAGPLAARYRPTVVDGALDWEIR